MNNEVTRDEYEALSAGMRLRNAREQLGLSQQAIAERLCLKVSVVRDIEEDKVPNDLALIFFRGYIRSYAKLVHISEKELSSIMKEHQVKAGTPKVFPIKSLSTGKRRKKNDSWLVSLIWLILFVIVGLVGALWLTDQEIKRERRTVVMTDRSNSEVSNVNASSNREIRTSLIQILFSDRK